MLDKGGRHKLRFQQRTLKPDNEPKIYGKDLPAQTD